jgi:uncharacterized protein YhfF
MAVPAHLQPFWNAFATACGGANEDRFYEAFFFGDSEALANELAELVLRGIKRATAGAVWSFELESKPLPEPGAISIVTNWHGEPLCVIETQSVEVMPFKRVSAEFAATEGEGDGSLSFWREAHMGYFKREARRSGREFTEDMLVACERFKLVYEFSSVNSCHILATRGYGKVRLSTYMSGVDQVAEHLCRQPPNDT